MFMPIAVGATLALGIGLMATIVGFDRERSFYSTVLIVVGSLYALFAVMGGSTRALALESVGAAIFLATAIVGFRRSMWLVAAGLALHGVFDFIHGRVIANPGVPAWWPGFCGAYDVVAAIYLGWLLTNRVGRH